jgi:dephospho-CoA kinase
MLKVGITGGIGSGKSTVCKVFSQLGIPVYHADARAAVLTDKRTDIRDRLIELFGTGIYNGSKLRRGKLASIIFNNKEALGDVNSIVHPAVRSDFLEWASAQRDVKYILFEAAILIESGTHEIMDKIIAVIAPEKTRISRVLGSKGYTGQIIGNIIKNQLPDKEKIKHAHYIINNDGKTLILPQIMEIHNKLVNTGSNRQQ